LSLTFCDVSKAFDRVWIRGLIYTIEKYGMRGDILEWFKTYLTDRKQKVIMYILISKDMVKNIFKDSPLKYFTNTTKKRYWSIVRSDCFVWVLKKLL
jgi:hypothetical protein